MPTENCRSWAVVVDKPQVGNKHSAVHQRDLDQEDNRPFANLSISIVAVVKDSNRDEDRQSFRFLHENRPRQSPSLEIR